MVTRDQICLASDRLRTGTAQRRALPAPGPAPAAGRTLASIVIADDHKLVRSALRMLLEAEAGIEVVAEAGDVAETMRKLLAFKPTVLLLDLSMPGGSGLEAIPRLRATAPRTAIVILTMQDDPNIAHAALRAGACAFVLKDAAETELIEAIRLAVDGHGYLNPELGGQIAAAPPANRAAPDGLTRRELQVLRLLATGYTSPEIADELCLAVRTVESHRAHIRRKVHRTSRAELVSYARGKGLIDE
jgi:two-component system response regulator NreC